MSVCGTDQPGNKGIYIEELVARVYGKGEGGVGIMPRGLDDDKVERLERHYGYRAPARTASPSPVPTFIASLVSLIITRPTSLTVTAVERRRK